MGAGGVIPPRLTAPAAGIRRPPAADPLDLLEARQTRMRPVDQALACLLGLLGLRIWVGGY